ncbi:hypothetical protein ABZ747_09365 [Kitasatospora cineracea]|uniref:hypothetical protein n=1 Tax=Kitasatospora cineracea TaxID=88074 RepID=UPI0033D84548
MTKAAEALFVGRLVDLTMLADTTQRNPANRGTDTTGETCRYQSGLRARRFTLAVRRSDVRAVHVRFRRPHRGDAAA